MCHVEDQSVHGAVQSVRRLSQVLRLTLYPLTDSISDPNPSLHSTLADADVATIATGVWKGIASADCRAVRESD